MLERRKKLEGDVVEMGRMFLAIIAMASLAFLFGCIGNSGMQPPEVCHNICGLNQTQAPYPGCACSGGSSGGVGTVDICRNICPLGETRAAYPDCRCSGGGYGTSGGNTSGGNGSWSGATPTPIPGSGGVGAGGETEDILLSGGFAVPRTEQGELFVIMTGRNTNETPYKSVNLSIREVSAFVVGSGPGWTIISTGNESVDMVGLGGRSVEIARNRVWTGKYARIFVEIIGIDAIVNGSGENANITMPRNKYPLMVMVPVVYGASSAVEIVIDLNRSFESKNGTTVFTPYIEVRSLDNIQYIIKDDGTFQMTAGTLDLSEFALFNETGGSRYSVIRGSNADCVQNCTLSSNSLRCASPDRPMCHAECMSRCFGEPIPPMDNACDDGTRFGSCSVNLPFRCTQTGQYISDCAGCGCPVDGECIADGTCNYAPAAISGGTCSPEGCVAGNQPQMCSHDGRIISSCDACGCPSGLICRSSDDVCVSPS